MHKRYFYIARTEAGDQHEFYLEGNSESIVAVEAKIEVERWLRDIGETPARLTQFDLTHTTP